MPTYEYACAACGHEWEQTQRITEAPVEVCNVCGKSTAHRLISAGTNFILKGGGWYSDLYASPKPSGDAAKPAAEVTEKKGKKKPEKGGDSAAASPETTANSDTKAASTGGATGSTGSTHATRTRPATGGSSSGAPSGTSPAPSG